MNLPEMLSVKDLQEHLHISKNRAYDLMKLKSFPVMKIGHRYFIIKDKYLKWLDENYKSQIIL